FEFSKLDAASIRALRFFVFRRGSAAGPARLPTREFSTINRMAEPPRPQAEEVQFSALSPERDRKPWLAMIIAVVVLGVALGLFLLLARGPRRQAAGSNPYAAQIAFSST